MFSPSCYNSASLLQLWMFLIPRYLLIDRMPTKAEEDPSPLSDYSLSDSYPLTCLTWLNLPGAYVPTSIALWVTGLCKPPHCDKVVVMGRYYILQYRLFTLSKLPDIMIKVSSFDCFDKLCPLLLNRLCVLLQLFTHYRF